MTLSLVDPETATGGTAELLASAKRQLGMVPNLFRGLAHSPAALEMYMQQSAVLSKGVLSPQLREQIALAVAGANQCDYCASAHTALGKGFGVSDDELGSNLLGESNDAMTRTVLRFARAVVDSRGHVPEGALNAVRDAGLSEEEIVEIIAHVGMNIFTNYFNHIAKTEIDFPVVDTCRVACAA